MSAIRIIIVLTFLIAGAESELMADVSRFSPATFTHLQPLERLSGLADQVSLKNMNSLALELDLWILPVRVVLALPECSHFLRIGTHGDGFISICLADSFRSSGCSPPFVPFT